MIPVENISSVLLGGEWVSMNSGTFKLRRFSFEREGGIGESRRVETASVPGFTIEPREGGRISAPLTCIQAVSHSKDQP